MLGNRKIAILISGRGSNMLALMDAIESGRLNAEIAVIISNRSDAKGVELAKARGYTTVVIPSRGLSKQEHEKILIAELKWHNPALICLAGYMRLLSPEFVQTFPQQILNIHPSLLPAFPGLEVQEKALEYGAKYSGCTVHFVDEGCDSGAIIAQAVVPIHDEDTIQSLADRILVEEHKLYAKAIQFILDRKWHIAGRRVLGIKI
ncbi:MAG: phosphoribosylglycinamide formyltransferase [Acidobacteria bacterium]|nr:phosphoribosylglycinamide formyltransferase [Acidobacteriota bacterium]